MAQDGHDSDNDKTAVNGAPNGEQHTTTTRPRHSSEADAKELVITSLRSQIQDLYTQVTQLNNKLVKSYDRVSDLEDEIHVTSSNLRASSLKVSQLELERTQHLSALNTGLLVEKSHVTAELNRLMEKATEEAAQRGQAESARVAIEKELDDLSASLFNQANIMVAEARYSKSLSERKVEEAEIALKGAEEAVSSMQLQMQALYAEKEEAERVAGEMRESMGKGKWVERRPSAHLRSTRLLSSHLPYHEFLLFVAHLRTLHISTATPPPMSTLLPLPFVSRLATEDSDPTVRLDLAPSLNWLSRRSVLSAIHNGQLTIEPVSSNLLHQEAFFSSTGSSGNCVVCALCGDPVFPSSDVHAASQGSSGSWSTSLFKKYPINGVTLNGSRPISPGGPPPPLPDTAPAQVFVFKVSSTTTLQSSALPNIALSLPQGFASSSSHTPSSSISGSQLQQHAPQSPSSTIYPLCTNGWCLMRLRQTCTLWAFVRTGVVEKVWEEEIPNLPPAPPVPAGDDKPPASPRRRGLWGALTERASSWTGGEEKKVPTEKEEREKELERRMKEKEKELVAKSTKSLPPPPLHPTIKTAPKTILAPTPVVASALPPPPPPRRRVPPALAPRSDDPQLTHSPVDDAPPRVSSTDGVHGRSSIDSIPGRPSIDGTSDRPSTPSLPAAHVPLPESRPATPGSPAAPPPLPRRAASRRPLSMALQGSSRPGTPSQLAKEDKLVEEPKVIEESKAVEDPNVVEEQKLVEEPVSVEESPKVAESAKDDDVTPGATVEQEITLGEPAQVEGPKEPVAEDVVVVPSGDTSLPASAPPPLPRRVPRPPPPPVEEDYEGYSTPPESIDEEAEDDLEAEKGLYIGDATWEERTWKELVKIKEDLFWARVGGVARV